MRSKWFIVLGVLCGTCLLHRPAAATEPEPTPRASQNRLHFHVGWPEGITYEVGRTTPSLQDIGPLSYFEEVYLKGRVGVRLDVDAAVFAADTSLPAFRDGIEARRAQFYLLGDFQLGLPWAYKFEFSVEGSDVFLNDFYLRWKAPRWVDAVDFGYITPPMGMENVVSSRSLTLMEESAPVQALAPGYRSGIAVSGHWEPWQLAWKTGFYSAGQEQKSGDASETSAQSVGRLAWRPWYAPSETAPRFVHVGASLNYVFSGNGEIRYRARPESFIAPFVVDTGTLPTKQVFQYALEGAWVDGPLLVSGELLQSYSPDSGNANLRGTYLLASWVLTGETHPYDGSTGMFTRLMPQRPFSFSGGWGAFEIGQRVSWLDLSDGPVHGGELLTLASGITWHLNQEFRLFANYVYAHVGDAPETGAAHIFQVRVEIGI